MADVRIEDNSDAVRKVLIDAVEIALESIGQLAVTNAKLEVENSPRRVDTGLLRNSITHAVSGKSPAIGSYSASNESKYGKAKVTSGSYGGTAPSDPDNKKAVYIGTNVEYAIYVHEGTRDMTANRFLRNAVEKNTSTYQRIIEDTLKGTPI